MIEQFIKRHPSITQSDDLKAICKPLDDNFGINYFCHVNVDEQGNFAGLGKNPKFVETYFKRGYYNADVHLSDNSLEEEYVLQDTVNHHANTATLFSDCKAHGLHHIFTILQRNKHSTDAFHFATNKSCQGMNEMYLRHLDSLKKFTLSFKDKVYSDKVLSKAYDATMLIDKVKQGYRTDASDGQLEDVEQFNKAISISRVYLNTNNKHSSLTQRELDCLHWASLAKTRNEIATILSISPLTVKTHINNIKQKLGCYNQFQLGMVYAKLKSLIE